eukprot:364439-Chlamydomonas_euryale.AAC.6
MLSHFRRGCTYHGLYVLWTVRPGQPMQQLMQKQQADNRMHLLSGSMRLLSGTKASVGARKMRCEKQRLT